LLESIVTASTNGQAAVLATCAQLTTAADEHLEVVKTAIKDVVEARSAVVDASRHALADTTHTLRASVDQLSASQEAFALAFKTSATDLDDKVLCVSDSVSAWADEQNGHLTELVHDVTKFVAEDFQRDTKASIPKGTYEYPTAFPKTQAYRNILTEEKEDWDREEKISTGAVASGQGVDFGRGALGTAVRPVIPSTPSAAAAADSDEEIAITPLDSKSAPSHAFSFSDESDPVSPGIVKTVGTVDPLDQLSNGEFHDVEQKKDE